MNIISDIYTKSLVFMTEIRKVEDNFTYEKFSVSHDGEFIYFITTSGSNTSISQSVSLDSFNSSFCSSFSLKSFIEAIHKVDESFFTVMVEKVINAFRNVIPLDEASIYVFQLFAILYKFPKHDIQNNQLGYSMGETDEGLFCLQFNDNNNHERFFVFGYNFFDNFFSTSIHQSFTREILKRIPKLALYYKFKDYFVRGVYCKVDLPEIEHSLKPFARKGKIKNILGD